MTTHAEDVQRYIDGVLSGERITGRLERLAVHRHVADLQHAGERGFYFDPVIADRAIAFAKLCMHYEGSEWANTPLLLRPEQKFVVWCLMGWRRTSSGMRRFLQAQLETARKWGKSFFASYLSALLLYADTPFEEGAQGYVCATKQEQATIVWKAAAKMIEKSPTLSKRAKITPSKYLIELPGSNSIFRPLASDKTPDGFNAHFIIKDEEHAWREKHRTQSNTLGSGGGARDQPLMITITTYGSDDSTIWLENHDYAVRCLESVITGEIVDDSWFAFICAIDFRPKDAAPIPCFSCKGEACPWCEGTGELPSDDPYDERVWIKANPGMGDGKGFTPKLEWMRARSLLAKQRADERSEFFQKNLNIIVASANKAITTEAWTASRGEVSLPKNVTGHGAFDLGRVDDFAAVAMVWPIWEVDDDGQSFVRYECVTKTWTVEDRPQSLLRPSIQQWIQDGHLIQCRGDSIDFREIEEAVLEWHNGYVMQTWAYDVKFAAPVAQRLVEDGVPLFAFGQSHKFYTAPLGELLRCVGRFRIVHGEKVPLFMHNGNPCLAWQAGNLLIDRRPNGEMMPDKACTANKIDAMVAILMAISECLYHQTGGDGYYLKNSLTM